MRRRLRLEGDHDNHDRWLISYADFITLLFAFFVVMYAVSAVNEHKYRTLSQAIGGAFGNPPPEAADNPPAPLPPRQPTMTQQAREQQRMTAVASNLMDVMAPLVKEGKVRVTQSRRGVSIEINANVLFAPGQAALQASSLTVLQAVAAKLRDEPFELEVTGHTDTRPISNSSYVSNWELSAARASSVVRLLAENGIASQRLYAIGREASQPLASNTTPEGRARNRRVELMILSAVPDPVREIPLQVPAAPRSVP
jgi:chemotaxis protein MotB